MNMVRTGVVDHPEEWDWCGYRELMGLKKRYRLIDMDALLRSVEYPSLEEFQKRYAQALNHLLNEREHTRQACWTESMAVGSEAFIHRVGATLKHRHAITYAQDQGDPKIFTLRESSGKGYQCS